MSDSVLPSPEKSGSTVLLIDDDPLFCELVLDVLKEDALDCEIASSLCEARKILAAKNCSVILLDQHLESDLDGIAFVPEIRSYSPLACIIMVTGSASLPLAMQAVSSGLYDFLLKPVDMDKLRILIRQALSHYELLLQKEALQMELVSKNHELRQINVRLHAALDEANHFRDHLSKLSKVATLGELTASVAHEFNNILGVIRGYAQLAQRTNYDPYKLLDYHQRINAASEKAGKIVKNLLYFSRSSESREQACINQAILQTLSLVEHHLELKNLLLKKNMEEIAPFSFHVSQIQQVFLNLITNAIQAMGPGGVLEISTREQNEEVILEFKDNGCGIPEEVKERIFEPFFSTKNPDTEGNGGTGLGLYISKQIIQAHDGCLSVRSKPEEGTCFQIRLPVKRDVIQRQYPQDIPLQDSCNFPLRAIVIDDDEEIRLILTRFLQAHGIETISFSNAKKALDYLQNDSDFDIVFSDLMMPDLNGHEFLEISRHNWPQIHVCITSGYGTKEIINEAISLGALRFLEKPFDFKEVLTLLMIIDKHKKNSKNPFTTL